MNKQFEYEKLVERLIDKKIDEVKYYEVAYENQEYWNVHEKFDDVDYGLDLKFDDETIASFTWGSEFESYGISLSFISLNNIIQGTKVTNVTNQSRWKNVVHNKITNVKVIWSWFASELNNEVKSYYPQDIILCFENDKKVIISTFQYDKVSPYYAADNISIFFNTEDAKTFEIGY